MISLKRRAGTELARKPEKRMRSTDTMVEADVMACGDVDGNVLLVARSLRLNLSLLNNVQTLRKHVVDYCFLDDWNYAHNEQLVYYNRHAALTRANMLTMLPDVVLCDAVIECWSMLMNRLETDEYDFQRMSFFGIRHMDYLTKLLQSEDQATKNDTALDNLYEMWDLYIQDCQDVFNFNADFIFVPFNIEGHFACVCFNYKSGTVDLLDHQLHPDPNKSKIGKLATVIGSALRDYLEAKGVCRGSEMILFEHHLRRKINRRYLVVQLTTALILADKNTIRDEVVGKVNQFLVEKDDIWTRVHAQRKIKKIVEKR
ncbi:hypothetical protein KSS87_000647 [Heliosperma pusillum]|nr:hypothetical protein KSS87_000647 [Heliosperma pusillum]